MNLRIQRRTDKAREAAVIIDDTVWGALPVSALPSFCFPGCEVTIAEEQALELRKLLRARALNILMARLAAEEISEHKARMLLKAKRFRADFIDAAIEQLISLGYLSDARFAEVLIRSWQNRGAGKHLIITKLRENRISASIWSPLLEEMWDPAVSADNLQTSVDKYIASHRELPARKLKDRTFSYFIRKGFSLDEITAAWERSPSDD